MKERRKFKRLAVEIPIQLEPVLNKKQASTTAYLFNSKNIAEAGMFLHTPIKYKKNQALDFLIKLRNDSNPIHLIGKIVWIANKKDHPYLYPGIGIKFSLINENDKKRLKKFLKSRLASYKDAREMKDMYLKLKKMAARLISLEEKHPTASQFKIIIDKAISEIDNAAHTIDREIMEIKKL